MERSHYWIWKDAQIGGSLSESSWRDRRKLGKPILKGQCVSFMVSWVTECPDGCRPCVWYSGDTTNETHCGFDVHSERQWLHSAVPFLCPRTAGSTHFHRSNDVYTPSVCRHSLDTARFAHHKISLRPRLNPRFCNCRIWQRTVTCGHMSRRGNNALVETMATCPFANDCRKYDTSLRNNRLFFVNSNLLLRSHDSFIRDTWHARTVFIILHVVGTGPQWPSEHLGITLEPNKWLAKTVQQLLALSNASVVW